ncbi:MAG: alpha/beta hydrolase [Candidatus Dormibacteraeota bacterium]|nr:alpha/beta hydrolase [Candidatus Dormibacteraeota bacterium]
MPEITTRRIATKDLALAVREHAGGEPAVLALHGLASNARWWDLVAERLAPRHRVVAVDLRGHGESDRPDTGYDFPTVVADLDQLLEQVHPGRLLVAGHSWGASVALEFAADYPSRTLGVVCVDGGATDLKAYFGPTWAMAEQTMKPPNLAGITPDVLVRWMESSPMSEGSDPETAARILLGNFEDDGTGHLRPRLTLEHHMQIAHHLFELDGYELMSRVSAPVLFVPAGHPDHEDMPKVHAMEKAKEVMGDRAHVAWVDGIHDIPVQRPTEVAAAITGFIDVVVRD